MALDKSAILMHNFIMEKINEFYKNFIKGNPNFPKNFVYFYQSVKDGSCYAIICNYRKNKSISTAILDKIKKLTVNSDVLSAFCEVFKDNFEIIELISDYILTTNNMKPTVDELLNYIQNSSEKEEVYIGKENSLTAYKLNEKMDLTDEVSFKLKFSIDEIKQGKQKIKRLFIDDAESFDRGKGLYGEILKKIIPNICIDNKIHYVVLQASAFETDLSGKGGQEKLENFYRANGFTRAIEESSEDPGCVKSSDFDEGSPIYYKEIDQEQEMPLEI